MTGRKATVRMQDGGEAVVDRDGWRHPDPITQDYLNARAPVRPDHYPGYTPDVLYEAARTIAKATKGKIIDIDPIPGVSGDEGEEPIY